MWSGRRRRALLGRHARDDAAGRVARAADERAAHELVGGGQLVVVRLARAARHVVAPGWARVRASVRARARARVRVRIEVRVGVGVKAKVRGQG